MCPYLTAALFLGLGFAALPVHPALAQDVVYDGSNPPMLQTDPYGTDWSLFPGTTAAPGLSGNNVTVNNGAGDIPGFVYGGVSAGADDIKHNTVTINDGTIYNPVMGGYSNSGAVTGNSVTFNGGTLMYGSAVFGGYSETGAATGNSVTINSGTLGGNVYGGYTNNDSGATGNTVNISGGAFTATNAYVFGGYNNNSQNGNATGNIVNIYGAPNLSNVSLYGGYGYSFMNPDYFSGNTLNVKSAGLTVAGLQNFQYLNFYLPATLNAGGTMLTVTGSAYLHPMTTSGSSEVNVNIMDGGATPWPGQQITLIDASTSIAGLTGTPANNTANGSIGAFDANGDFVDGPVNLNFLLVPYQNNLSAYLKGLDTPGDLNEPDGYGLASFINPATDSAESVSLKVGGTLTVGGAFNLDNSDGGGVSVNIGTLQIGSAGTTLTATGLNPGDAAIGTLLLTNDQNFILTGPAASAVSVGQLKIDGGTLNDTNWGNLAGGGITYSTTPDITLGAGGATVDTASIQTLSRNLVGTGALTKDGAGTLTLSGANTYTGNTTISVGTLEVTGSLGNGNYGGAIENDGALIMKQTADQTLSGAITGGGSLTKDGAGTLTLTGASDNFGGPIEVRGGTLALSGAGSLATDMIALYDGATFVNGGAPVNLAQLDVHGSANWTGNLNMANQTMNFYVPTAMIGTGSAMLTVTGNANVTGSQVNVGIPGASLPLKAGDTVTLINAATLTGAPANTKSDNQWIIGQGATIDYTFDLSETANQLVATISGSKAADQSKALSEGFLAGPALINQTGDFVAGKGTAQAVETTGGGKPGKQGRSDVAGGYGLGTFGAVSGGWNRYNTGSNVDMSSLSLMAGLAWGNDLTPGRLTLGAFFEYGNGWYDTYNSFAMAPDARGKGNIYHLGGGILGRLDFNESGAGNFYTEASLRAGGVSNDYKNGDLNGQPVNYDSSSAYYGAHAGLGYVWNLTEKSGLDFYGKYFWTRQNGDSVGLSSGETVRFDSVDSHRLRLGGRFVYAVNDLISPYAGLAYEQEFDGKAKATAYNLAIDAPSLQGGTGIGEIGLNLKPAKDLPLSCDFAIQGYVGVREGFTGSAQARYDF